MFAINDTQLLESYAKALPSIYNDRKRIQTTAIVVEDALAGINKESFRNCSLPVRGAIIAGNIKQFLTLQGIGAHCSDLTLVLAVAKKARDIAHKLLLDGFNPNINTPDGNSLLSVALDNNDLKTAYLLLAYGATCSEDEAKKLKRLTDPLQVSGSDIALFAATAAYWLARSSGNSYLPTIVDSLAGTWFCYNAISPTSNRSFVALSLAALEMLPATNVAMRIITTASLATKAFSAIKAAYNNLSPGSIAKATIHSVNAMQSCYTLQQTVRFEYSESQLIKSLYECHRVSTDDISDIEALDVTARMNWVIEHPHTSDCPPILERAYPGWTCQNFKSKFHKETLTHHPDKGSAHSLFQTILNSANKYWQDLCRK